jgi:LAO/AO transport system kinase
VENGFQIYQYPKATALGPNNNNNNNNDNGVDAYVLPDTITQWPSFITAKQIHAAGQDVLCIRKDASSVERRKLILEQLLAPNNSHVIVIGTPGVGKSTFINRLILTHDFGSHKVAILAIDPSSRITKGAVLGDRIRITQNSVFENLYFRSIASRGAYGGLSDSIESIIYFLANCEFTLVLIETVGVGQNEVDIAKYADTVIYVLDSNAGDEVQMEKAGVMEVGDIYFVNIRDKQINHQFISNLQSFTSYSNRISSRQATVVAGSAINGEGFGELSTQLDAFTNHFKLVD